MALLKFGTRGLQCYHHLSASFRFTVHHLHHWTKRNSLVFITLHFGDPNFEPKTGGSFPCKKMLELCIVVVSFQEWHQMAQRIGLAAIVHSVRQTFLEPRPSSAAKNTP